MAYLRARGNFFEERDEAVGEGVAVGEDAGAELRELEQDWSQLGAEDFHGGEKFFELGVAVGEDFVVGDGARGFDGENKIVGSFGGPVFYGARRGAAVEGGVYFDAVEVLGVEGQKVLRFDSWWIEGALPACRGEGGGAEVDFGVVV